MCLATLASQRINVMKLTSNGDATKKLLHVQRHRLWYAEFRSLQRQRASRGTRNTHSGSNGHFDKVRDERQIEQVWKHLAHWDSRHFNARNAAKSESELFMSVIGSTPLSSAHVADERRLGLRLSVLYCLATFTHDELHTQANNPSHALYLDPNRDRDMEPVINTQKELDQQVLAPVSYYQRASPHSQCSWHEEIGLGRVTPDIRTRLPYCNNCQPDRLRLPCRQCLST